MHTRSTTDFRLCPIEWHHASSAPMRFRLRGFGVKAHFRRLGFGTVLVAVNEVSPAQPSCRKKLTGSLAPWDAGPDVTSGI